MGASYGKLTPGHEEAIYRLRKEKNGAGRPRTGIEIQAALARGIDGERPVSISPDRALKVARRLIDERDELYTSDIQKRPPHEGLRLLTKRLLVVAERETIRIERAEKGGRLDAAKLGKLAAALVKIHGLLERLDAPDPSGGAAAGDGSAAGAVPSTFAHALVSEEAGGQDEEQASQRPQVAPVEHPPMADEVLAPVG